MPGFEIAGSQYGYPTNLVNMHTGESMYEGQLLMAGGALSGEGGHVMIADAASEAEEDDQPIIGICKAIMDGSRTYSSTYFGNGTTFTQTQATILANGPSEVQVALIDVGTLVLGPVRNAALTTALTELEVTTASTTGATITHANDTLEDLPDDYSTAYCRSGANQGQYRVIKTGGANAQVVGIPFKGDMAVGDVYIAAACTLGEAMMEIPAAANCVDGNNAHAGYYNVFGRQLLLEESMRETFMFSFRPSTWLTTVT